MNNKKEWILHGQIISVDLVVTCLYLSPRDLLVLHYPLLKGEFPSEIILFIFRSSESYVISVW